MLKIKLTSKRQATFPVRVCESLGVSPGDDIFLDSREGENGLIVWQLKTARTKRRPWLGALRKYAQDKDHSMESIRSSIGKARSSRKND